MQGRCRCTPCFSHTQCVCAQHLQTGLVCMERVPLLPLKSTPGDGKLGRQYACPTASPVGILWGVVVSSPAPRTWQDGRPAFQPSSLTSSHHQCLAAPPRRPPNSTHFLSIEVEGASVQPMVLVLEGSQGREFYSGCERSNCINARQKAWGWPVSATSDLSDSCAAGRGQE